MHFFRVVNRKQQQQQHNYIIRGASISLKSQGHPHMVSLMFILQMVSIAVLLFFSKIISLCDRIVHLKSEREKINSFISEWDFFFLFYPFFSVDIWFIWYHPLCQQTMAGLTGDNICYVYLCLKQHLVKWLWSAKLLFLFLFPKFHTTWVFIFSSSLNDVKPSNLESIETWKKIVWVLVLLPFVFCNLLPKYIYRNECHKESRGVNLLKISAKFAGTSVYIYEC